jgi:hypothetical protein
MSLFIPLRAQAGECLKDREFRQKNFQIPKRKSFICSMEILLQMNSSVTHKWNNVNYGKLNVNIITIIINTNLIFLQLVIQGPSIFFIIITSVQSVVWGGDPAYAF